MNEQKIGIVFGGSMGIGEATAKLLKEEGTRVTIVGRDKARLAAAAARIGEVDIAVADALDADAISRVFETTGSVDTVVICVAGSKGIGLFRDLNDVKVYSRRRRSHNCVSRKSPHTICAPTDRSHSCPPARLAKPSKPLLDLLLSMALSRLPS